MNTDKKAAQFRTPRHLIRVLTQMVEPKIGGTVCDPACSSGGSSILAEALWAYYNSRSLSIPEIVEKWRATCLSPDEFSEIRNAWGDCERV